MIGGMDYATRPRHRCPKCGQKGRWRFLWRIWECIPCGWAQP